MSILSAFIPALYVDSIFSIDLEGLLKSGIRGLIFDLDNTLVRWGTIEITDELRAFLEKARNMGFSVCILSNNFKERSRRIAEELGVTAIGNAMKPSTKGFRRAIGMMKLTPGQVAVVGDQLFTDILGGNRVHAYTILVKPLWDKELIYTKAVRRIERLVLNRLNLNK